MRGTTALLLLLAGLASWELLAPRRSRTTSRLLRWPTNVLLGGLNILVTRSLLVPLTVATAVAVLGLPPAGVLAYGVLATVLTLATHGNGRVPPGLEGAIRWLLVTPDMHRIHHSARPLETDSNFATVFSVWDRLLRTHRATPIDSHHTMPFGLTEVRDARFLTIPWTLALPFLPVRRGLSGPQAEVERAGKY